MSHDRFFVDCPGCDDEKGPFITLSAWGQRVCDCGTMFRIDVESKSAHEVPVE